MSVFIHVGYPKTATTWLQQNFFPFVQDIKIYDRKFIKRYFIDPGAFDFNNIEEIKTKFNTSKEQNIWLSEELLTAKLRTGGVNGFVTKEIANRLKLVFPEAKIIIFIRNQIDILASSYIQYIRGGGNYSINKFLFPEKYSGTSSNSVVLFNIDFFQYHKIIEYYSNLFGRENIYIFLYEEFSVNPSEFITLFSQKFNLKYNTDEIDYSKVNMGYRFLLIYTRRISNIFSRIGPLNKYYIIHIPKWHPFVRKIHEIANQYIIFGKKLSSRRILGKKNYDYLMNYYKKSNQILVDEFGLSKITKYNYPI